MRTATRSIAMALATMVASTALLCLSLQPANAAACAKQANWGKAQSCDQKLAWNYNPESQSFDSAGVKTSAGDPAGDKYSYEYFNVCNGAQDCRSRKAAGPSTSRQP